MEVKKRPADSSTDEPASKKHVSEDIVEDGHLTKSRLKKFKKDAIYRALQAVKIEKDVLAKKSIEAEKKLASLEKAFALQESWWDNFSDQINVLLSNGELPHKPLVSSSNFVMKISADDEPLDKIESAYNEKNSKLQERIAEAFKLSPEVSSSDDSSFQDLLSQSLKDLHQLKADNSTFRIQNSRLQQQLDEIVEKYYASEKKVERLKSKSLKTLFGKAAKEQEQEHLPKVEAVKSPIENGQLAAADSASSEELQRLTLLLDQSEAVVKKQRSQMDQQDDRIDRLNETINHLSNKLANLTDAEVIQSPPFRALRRRHNDLLAQYDKLEAQNERYYREKIALINERADFQQSLRAETDARVQDLQKELAKCNNDLSRIRLIRDDLISALNIKKSTENEKNRGMEYIKELADTRQARIDTLETEIKRLKDDPSLEQLSESKAEKIENSSPDELKEMVKKLQRQYSSLVSELTGLEAAFTSAHTQATAKVNDLVEREGKVTKLVAEKTKADEKYFSAMRAKDALNLEFQKVKTQLSKSAEWVQQLKDAEKKHILKISSLETKIEDLNAKQSSAEKERLSLRTKLADADRKIDQMRGFVDKLNGDIKLKERSIKTEIENRRSIEIENEKLKRQVEIRNLTTANGVGAGKNGTAMDLERQLEELRSIAICSVCTKNWKDTAIKVCGHVICNDCAVSRLASRLRKCPLCNRQFSQSDLLPVHL